VQEVITVAATTVSDARASGSNHGGCIDIFAPGVNVLTAASTGDSDYTAASGTSFAAPYVAGAIATYLQVHPSASPSQVIAALQNRATPGIVTDAKSTSNYLLFSLLAPSVTIMGPTAYSATARTYTWTTAANGGTGSYTYQWQERMMWPDGYQELWQNISGATGSTLTRTKGSYTVDTEYRVLLSTGTESTSDTHVVTGSCRLNNTCPS
jgi:subtilisin family serine protease